MNHLPQLLSVIAGFCILGGCARLYNPVSALSLFGLTTSSPSYTFYVGDTITITPTMGSAVTSVSISPSLGSGLSLNTSTGVISGTATGSLSKTSYTLTSKSSTGQTATATFDLTIIGNYGSGADGPVTVSSNSNVNSYVSVSSASLGATALTTAGDVTANFHSGDLILILQIQGANGGTNWELNHIASINSTTITLTSPLKGNYNSGTFNSVGAVATQVVRVPQYSSFTLNVGISITPSPWNGTTGGVVALVASGTITINGSISVAGSGFRAGTSNIAMLGNVPLQSQQGESWMGLGTTSTLENAGAGGGVDLNGVTCSWGAGAGGAYGTAGSIGGTFNGNATAGAAGSVFGTANLAQIFFGAGGGGAAHNCSNDVIVTGSGGGLVLIFGSTITVAATGAINADGTGGQLGASGESSGSGAGGSVYLKADTLTLGTNIVTALGGSTGISGGNGRIRLDYNSVSGTTNPVAGFTGVP